MLNKIRYYFATLKHSMSYANSINEHFLDYYLRHHKVIGWHDGRPVYSSFLTPGLSSALGHTIARRLISNIVQQPLPGVAHVSVTDVCNANCEHCSFFGAMEREDSRALPTEDFKQILKECQDFGISVLNFVGGEPLMNKDLPELIRSLDKNKTVSSVYTNGWFTSKYVHELKKAGLMAVITSLDSTKAKEHDRFRKLPGLFERAVEGIKAVKRAGMIASVSMTITQDGLEAGELEEMIEFCKDIGVAELIVFDTMPVGMYSHRADLSARPVDRKMLFRIVDEYNDKKGYPGIFAYAHFKDANNFGCSAGRNYFYITPYGEMCPCDFTATPIGNVLEQGLAPIWWKLVNMRGNNHDHYMNACCDNRKAKRKGGLPLIEE